MSKWNKASKLEAADMFSCGISISRIAEHFGCSKKKVCNSISDYAMTSYAGEFINELAVIEAYESGTRDLPSLSKKFKTTEQIVKKCLVRSGRRVSSLVDNREFAPNDNFFDTLNEVSAYWLGFIMADGYVYTDLSGIGISLDIKDKSHIEQFCLDIDYDGNIRDYNYNGISTTSRVELKSSNIVSDLISYGCVPRKTHVLEPPVGVKQSFYRDLIRGYVDGDGAIGWHSAGQPRLRVCGTYPFLDWLRVQGPSEINKPHRMKSIWEVSVNGKNKAMEWIEWLYSPSERALSRKYDTYIELRNSIG